VRVAFYTNVTAADSLCVLQRLGVSQQHEVVRVYLYDTVAEAKQSPLKIVRELGWRRVLQKLVQVLCQRWGRLLGWVWRRPPGPVRTAGEWAERLGVPCRSVTDLNHPAWVAELRDEQIDVLLVCICKNILRRGILDVPRLGAINIHPSLLPRYRGPLPIFWMLYRGDSQAGVTFQRMTERIDAGPILAQFPATIDLQRTESEISRQLFELAAEHVDEVLAEFTEGSENARGRMLQMDGNEGDYFSYPTVDEIRELSQRQRAGRHR